MKWQTLSSIFFATVAVAAPQGVGQDIRAKGATPAGCKTSYQGQFQIVTHRIQKRQATENVLTLTLHNGVLKDSKQRTGYIASNFQFQFDNPPQSGALATSGFAVCTDNLMALGSSKTFYQCRSGNFYNLYDRTWAPQCEPVNIKIMPVHGGDSSARQSNPADQANDGQVAARPDGQPTVATQPGAGHVTQIADGQIQGPTGTASELPEGQVRVPTKSTTSHRAATTARRPATTKKGGKLYGREKRDASEMEKRGIFEKEKRAIFEKEKRDAEKERRAVLEKVARFFEKRNAEKEKRDAEKEKRDAEKEKRNSNNEKRNAEKEKRAILEKEKRDAEKEKRGIFENVARFFEKKKRRANQIDDGQIQVQEGPEGQVEEMTEGQAEAPTGGLPVSQIQDGQIQVHTGCACAEKTSTAPVPPPTMPPSPPVFNTTTSKVTSCPCATVAPPPVTTVRPPPPPPPPVVNTTSCLCPTVVPPPVTSLGPRPPQPPPAVNTTSCACPTVAPPPVVTSSVLLRRR
ncbi:hypothetical protein ACO1O0_007036 [Amphichorda felina]